MPGSKGNRTKGNVKPSSSSRAAELLTQSGTAPVGFVGFGGFGSAQAYVPASQVFDDVDTCLDSDFRLVLRKLTKRDATTKIKSLGEFSALCKEKDDSTLEAVLPFWPRLFNKLAIDVDSKVRECTQNAMAVLAGRVRRNLAPYLKNVMGAWILSRNDTYPTVASAANKSFSAAFPPDKQENAIMFCKQSVLEYMTDNLLNQTAATLSDPKTTEKEEMEAKYQRVLSSSLMGLRQLLLALPAAQVDDSLKGHLRGLLNDAKFWNLAKSQVLTVRCGLFWFLGSLCKGAPEVAGEYTRKLSPMILGSIDCMEPGLTAAVWDAVLSLVKFVPACWENINWQKAFWPKLRKVLESGCQGNAASVAPNLLPLLSCVPLDTAGGAAVFFPKVLELFKEGFSKDCIANSPSETNIWTRAFIECLQFSIKQISNVDSSDAVLESVFLDQLLPVVEASLSDPKSTLSRSQLYSLVSVLLRTVTSDTITFKVSVVFWSHLREDLGCMFENQGFEKNLNLHPDRLVSFVKALLHPQDISCLSGTKGERVTFGTKMSRAPTSDSVPADADIPGEVKTLVKDLITHSYKQYQRERQCVHLKLFVDLANMYFPVDIATFVLQSLENDTDSEKKTTETPNRTETEENCSDPHSNVIAKVVFPVLGAKEGTESDAEIIDHTITLLFACLPYLSQESSTNVWDSTLQTVHSTGALCSLIERALEKRHIMPQVSSWLSSPYLHSQLNQLVKGVTTKYSSMEPGEIEQGWRVICLVLSANDNNEPVFPDSWIVDILSHVHQELVTLARRTLGPQEPEDVRMVIQFVARAALTFFQNLKTSLCMSKSRDMIEALLIADLDSSLLTSGEASSVLRQSWTTGLGIAVQQTGGLIQEGSVLASACGIVRETLQNRTQTMEQYRLVVEVTEELLKTVRNHLPCDDTETDDKDHFNPALLQTVSELFAPLFTSVDHSNKIIEYHCLTGQLPLTVLDSVQRGEKTSSMTSIVFSSLFNLYLLHCNRSGFKFDSQHEFEGGLTVSVWCEEDIVILSAVRSLCVATTWLKLESQVPSDTVNAIEELTKVAHACFLSSCKSMQQDILTKAFVRAKDDAMMVLTFSHLAHLQSMDERNFEEDFFQDLCFSLEPGYPDCLVAVADFIPEQMAPSVFQQETTSLTSITDDSGTVAAAVSELRLMGKLLSTESANVSATFEEKIQGVVSKLKTIRDNDSQLFLFSCDISEEPLCKVAFNISVMQFLTAVVNCDACKLPPDQWDFILCSTVSWIESLDSSGMKLASAVNVQSFCVGVCQLLTALSYTMQHRVSQSEDVYPPNVKTEWTEFFAEGIYSLLFPLFIRLVEELKETKKKGEAAVILRAVGSAMSLCPPEQVTGHQLPLNLSASDDTSPIPESLQTILNYLCPALICSLAPAQVTAYAVLDKIVTLLPTYNKKEEEGASASASAEDEMKSRAPPAVLMKVIEDCATAMDIVVGSVAIESSVTMVPGSEEYQFALGYLLAWQLLLRLFHSADSTGRAEYALYLKEHSSVEHLLTHLFRLMPVSPCSSSAPSSQSQPSFDGSPFKPDKCRSVESGKDDSWFSSSAVPLTAVDVGQPQDIQRASCCMYLHCLQVIPVLVRQWWKDQDRKSAAYVDKFTTRHVSPHLIKSEMQLVSSSDSPITDLQVKANAITRQVTACYTTEELKAEIQVTLPESFPLGEITVNADRHAVVKLAHWDRLLLQISVFLQHQNGSILEGLRLWKRNIDKKLEGVEECFICYSVIHATSLEMPRIPCKTCKKKFHSSCLYKWLNSSQQATCPLCRSIFF